MDSTIKIGFLLSLLLSSSAFAKAPTKMRVEMNFGFKQAAKELGISWTDLFRAYRAGGRKAAPGSGKSLEILLTDPPRRRGSFFQRMPMDDWRTPEDGVWGCSRSGGRRRHKGIDMHAPQGTPIYAVADGWVYRSWNTKHKSKDGGYGNYVILEHEASETSGQRYWTYYTHMRDNPEVQEGEWVPAGLQLGTVGLTPLGRFENPHLHFEVRHGDGSELGKAVNPTPFGPFRQHFVGGEGAY